METRNCQNCKNEFTIEPDDFSFYEKMKVPAPTFCPECRMIRRLAWRNNRSLHRRDCNLCGKSIVTIYSPEAPFPVYCNPCWFGDGWDPTTYGQDIDWDRPFLEQWFDLWNRVPKFARWAPGNVKNSDYCNSIIDSSNCYLSYSIVGCEDVLYSENIDYGKSMVDSFLSIKSNDCYVTQGSGNYKSMFLSQSSECIDSKFLFDCINCQDCFMSCNLRNKKYFFRNKQLTKDEYKNAIEKEDTGNRKKLSSLVLEWKSMIENIAVRKYSRIVVCQNATGNFIRNARNAKHVFFSHDFENVAYGGRVINGAKDSYDIFGLGGGELIYECMGCSFGTASCRFSINSNGSQDIHYCAQCMDASNLFGCVSIRKKKYFILNKEYSKEEYEKLIPKLIEHMNIKPYIDGNSRVYMYGEFLPFDMSPFGYNETQAFDFYPISKQEILDKGYNWYQSKDRDYKVSITNENIPMDINEVDDSIISEIIECEHSKNDCQQQCTKAFKITAEELTFYRKMNIALPGLCPNCRYYERLPVLIQPMHLWHRSCMCNEGNHGHKGTCPNEFETSYAPNRSDKVYCEQCYQQEVL